MEADAELKPNTLRRPRDTTSICAERRKQAASLASGTRSQSAPLTQPHRKYATARAFHASTTVTHTDNRLLMKTCPTAC